MNADDNLPYVGVELEGFAAYELTCTFAPYEGDPICGQRATTHLATEDYLGMRACDGMWSCWSASCGRRPDERPRYPTVPARPGGAGCRRPVDRTQAQAKEDPMTCVFCQIIAGESPATIVRQWRDAIAIVPLGPVVEGHLLVIPRTHVEDWTTGAYVSAITMHAAAELAQELNLGPCNLITSKGKEATQSVFHLHLHIVPRAENDGLALPWYSGRRKRVEVSR